jgi:hypothetical protein
MENFYIVIKTLGDIFLPVAGFLVGLCAVSPASGKRLIAMEEAMKASVCARRLFGVLLMAFCVIYAVASVHIQLSLSKKPTPIHDSAITLASEIDDFANQMKPNTSSEDSVYTMQSFRNRFAYRVNTIREALDEAGRHSDELDTAADFYAIQPNNFNAAYLHNLARLIKILSKDLQS